MDILKLVKEKLEGEITEANFEGANIVVYTENKDFFRNGEQKIKEIVNEIKKRVELRIDPKVLPDKERVESKIKEIVPEEAEITNIIYEEHRSVVIIEAKKPGMVIGKQGSTFSEIKRETFWTPQVQRSPAIKSKITENIRSVLYANNNYRRRFLNNIGKKIYSEWSPEKSEGWVRVTTLGGARQVGRSCFLLQTSNSKVLLDCGVDVASSGKDKYPYFNIPEFDISDLDAVVISHAHLDHVGLLPYLYKMGYKGPVYMTPPTRDIAALLALDYIGVAYKQATHPIYGSKDIQEMVKHSICLDYDEVTDITPDVRITLYNAGHVLGSAQIHINIGNGRHNFIYTGDTKYGRTRLLDKAVNRYQRVESIQIESTYGGKQDVLPPRRDVEDEFIQAVSKTIEKGGKVLLPELGLGHAQETVLRVEEAIRQGKLKDVPLYVDGMIWDVNAIHTAYPDFLNRKIRSKIFQDDNPFISDILRRVGSSQERSNVIQGGPCIVIATNGMLQGGASVEYFKNFAGNPDNLMILSSYQGPGSLGRRLQEGERNVTIEENDGETEVDVKMRIEMMKGLSPHSSKNELMAFFNNMRPKPRRIIVNHGEISKSLDLASSLYKSTRTETNVPRTLETLRLR